MDSYIGCDEYFSVNNVLRKYKEMKKEIKNSETSVEYNIWKKWKCIPSVVKKTIQVSKN